MARATTIMATVHIIVAMQGLQGAMTTKTKATLGAMQGLQGALTMMKHLKVTTGETPLLQAAMVMMVSLKATTLNHLKDTIGAVNPAMSVMSMSKSKATTTTAMMQMGHLPMVLAPTPTMVQGHPMTIGAIKPSTTQG